MHVPIQCGQEMWKIEGIQWMETPDLEYNSLPPVTAFCPRAHAVCPAAHCATRSDRLVSPTGSVRWNNGSAVGLSGCGLCNSGQGRHAGEGIQRAVRLG